jgi:spermidine/putrescine transport system substrate-binding protein
MTHRGDGSTIDLERELTRYLLRERISRRQLMERIGKVGAGVALAPVIAASTRAGGSAAPSTSPAVPSASAGAGASDVPASATPVPSPESELFIYNWTDYLGEGVIESFEEKYNVKVTQDFFSNTEEAYAKLGSDGGGYDLSFPISVDVPSFVEKGALLTLDKSLIPNIANLGTEWADPGYDPGNEHTVPYMWWTTGIGYDSTKVTDSPTSSTALWDPRYDGHISMLDDFQEVFELALIQLGFSANTTDTAQMDQALALLQQQKPLVRVYSTDTIGTMSSGDVWIGHIWGADTFAIQEENENVLYYIPSEGGVKGSDTLAIFSGAKHPIAAHLFINHMLDAEVSAANTNYIYYMGPNAAAKEFIDPAILEDPAINPDAELVAKLEELLDLGPAVRDEYLTRWQTLRGS